MAETGERSKHDVAEDSRPESACGWPETTKTFFQAQYTAQDIKSLAFRVFDPDFSFKIHIFDVVKFKRFFEKVHQGNRSNNRNGFRAWFYDALSRPEIALFC